MEVSLTPLKDCLLIKDSFFQDNRGFFSVTYNREEFKKKTGLLRDFTQDNLAYSTKGAVRGLHFQTGEYSQAKLVSCIKGAILDVVVDIRPESETFGKYFAVELSESNHQKLYVPHGFAHGYSVLSQEAYVMYKVDNTYSKAHEGGIIFNDPYLAIDWKVEHPVLSEKDQVLPTFGQIRDSEILKKNALSV